MSDARDCESYLRQLQETIKRQYTCDKNSRLSKLEDLLQDSMVSDSSYCLCFNQPVVSVGLEQVRHLTRALWQLN